MPIIQISEIRHRRGLKQDLPELAEGEVGLAVDTGELFIGTPGLPSIVRDLIAVVWQPNKDYAEGSYVAFNGLLYRALTTHNGAAVFNGSNWEEVNQNEFANPNTKILTEWSKNIETILKYSYLNRNSQINSDRPDAFGFHEIENFYEDLPDVWPYQAVKRVGNSTYDEIGVRRYLQERLDERVSVLSYGASGSGRKYLTSTLTTRIRNDMDAEANSIRRATMDLANSFADDASDANYREANKAVYFPAGTYVVNKSLFLTNRTRWIGDGVGKTRIVFNINGLTLNQRNNALLMTVDKSLSVEDAIDEDEVTANSYQNITDLVQDIVVSGISFEIMGTPAGGSTASAADTLRLLRAANVVFHDCAFIGSWNPANTHTSSFNYTTDAQAVFIDSVGDTALPGASPLQCRDIKFLNCHFEKFFYISNLVDGMNGITFDSCTARTCYRGIVVGEANASSTGIWQTFPVATSKFNAPRNVRILNSNFKDIASHGVFVYRGYLGNGTDNSTTYNEYLLDEKVTGDKPFYQGNGVLLMGNRWENVGNYDNNQLVSMDHPSFLEDPKVPVIVFADNSNYNSIIGDTFSRDITVTTTISNKSRVYYRENDPNIVLIPQDRVRLPSEKQTYQAVINPTAGMESMVPAAIIGEADEFGAWNSYRVSYTIVYAEYGAGPLRRRKFGTINIAVDPSLGSVNYSDDSTMINGPDDITLSVIINDSDEVELQADFSNSLPDITDAVIYYSIEKYFAPV